MTGQAGRTVSLRCLDIGDWSHQLDELLDGEAIGDFRLSSVAGERLQRYLRSEDARRGAGGEFARHLALAQYGGVELAAARVERDRAGKPWLPDHPDVWFNLSHSGDLVVCGVDCLPLGVDVELVRAIEPGIARSCFTPAELRWLENGGNGFEDRFFTLWTLKESILKAWGVGFSVDPREIEVQPDSERPGFWRSVRMDEPRASLVLQQLAIAEGYCGAIATVEAVSIDLKFLRPEGSREADVSAISFSNHQQ